MRSTVRNLGVTLAAVLAVTGVAELGTNANASVSASPLASHVVVGASVADLPSGRADLPALENQLGGHLGIASAFVGWDYVIGGPNETWMSANGTRQVLLSWEPWGVRFSDVTGGKQDAYLQRVADSMKASTTDVYVRPWPEMNGNWSTWQPTADGAKPNGGTPAQFVAAWRYLVTFMHSRGVTNLKFVFNPDSSNWSSNTPIPSIWPGADYVDVLGMDGYNWGNSAAGTLDTGDRWRSFDTTFSTMYGILTGLDASAPVWVTEVGCKEPQVEDDYAFPKESSPVDPGNDKGAWIDAMMASTSFPRIEAIVWFNIATHRNWPLDSSFGSLAAMRQYLAPAASPSPSASTSSVNPTVDTSSSPTPPPPATSTAAAPATTTASTPTPWPTVTTSAPTPNATATRARRTNKGKRF